MTQGPRVLYTFVQAARAFGVRRELVETWVADGRLVPTDLEGRQRISLLEIERVQREGIPAVTKPEPTKRRQRRARGVKPPADPGKDIRDLEI